MSQNIEMLATRMNRLEELVQNIQTLAEINWKEKEIRDLQERIIQLEQNAKRNSRQQPTKLEPGMVVCKEGSEYVIAQLGDKFYFVNLNGQFWNSVGMPMIELEADFLFYHFRIKST
jgi:hypothetical protein